MSKLPVTVSSVDVADNPTIHVFWAKFKMNDSGVSYKLYILIFVLKLLLILSSK